MKSNEITYKKLVVKYIEIHIWQGYDITNMVFHHRKIDKNEMINFINQHNDEGIVYKLKQKSK